MKLLALIFIPCLLFANPSDTVSVAKSDVLKNIDANREQAMKKFQASLSKEQLKLQKAIEAMEIQFETIDAIKQDSIRVRK